MLNSGIGLNVSVVGRNSYAPSRTTDEKEFLKKQRQKVKALYNGNIDQIFEVYSSENTGSWYKFANDSRLLNLSSPLKSDMIAKTLNTLTDLIYSDATISSNNIGFRIKTLIDIEKVLQLNGEVIITVDWIGGTRKFTTLSPDEYEVEFDEFGFPTEYHIFSEFEYEDETYILENVRYVDKNIMRYYVYVDRERGSEEINYLNINQFYDVLGIRELYTAPHKFVYKLETEYRYGKIVELVELLDQTLTYINLSTRQSIPTTYLPEDVAESIMLDDIDVDPENPFSPVDFKSNVDVSVDSLYQRLCGIMKVPTLSDGQQKIDVVAPIVQAESYENVYRIALNELLSILGISAGTLNSTILQSGQGTNELNTEEEKLSIKTRNALIVERKEQFKTIFEDIGEEITIDFANFGVNIEPTLLTALNELVNSNNMSKETMISLIFPHWEQHKVNEEIDRLYKLQDEHINAQIAIAGHSDLQKNK